MIKKWMYNLCLITTTSTPIAPYAYYMQKWYVIGGQEVLTNKYPWFATIRDWSERENSLPLGGGALIDREWVLTTGHLFTSSWNYENEPNIKITFNQSDLDNDDHIITVFAKKVVLAPNYDQGNDLAMIKLDRPVENITPIDLNHHDLQFDKIATTMGYGRTDVSADSIPTKLHEVDLPIIDPLQNHQYLNSIGYVQSEYNVIGGHMGGIIKSPTVGDIGGPLIQEINGHLKIIGIYKSAIVHQDHEDYQYPTIFTSINKNIEWIQKNLDLDHQMINQKIMIQNHFFKPFVYEKHLFSKTTKRQEVKRFVDNEIRTIFDQPFDLTMENEEGFVVDQSNIVPNGDYFNFELRSKIFSTKFRFLAENVGNKNQNQAIFDQVKTKFKNEIDFTEHQLTVEKVRGDAFLFVHHVISQIANQTLFNLTMNGFNANHHLVNDAHDYVWKGDWFDFVLSIPGQGQIEFRFLAKNVAGLDQSVNQFNRVQDYFRVKQEFTNHLLTTSHTRHDAQMWVQANIAKIVDHTDFFLNSYNSEYNDSRIKMINTNDQIDHGDSITLNLSIGHQSGDLHVYFKNVGNDFDQGTLWDMIDYWDINFKKLTNFTTQSDELELLNYIHFKLLDKFQDAHFRILLLQNGIHKHLTKLASYVFELSIGSYEHRFSLILGSLQTVVSNKNHLLNFFTQEFLFYEHQLTTKNTRHDAKDLVLLWLKKITNFYVEFLSTDFDEISNVVNNSSLVSNGDWFEIKVKIDNQEIDLVFKVKNVQKRSGSGYLQDAVTIFARAIEAYWYMLNSTMNYEKIYEVVLQIIKNIHGSVQATFSLIIQKDNLQQQIGSGNKTFPFQMKIDNVTQSFAVTFLNIPE